MASKERPRRNPRGFEDPAELPQYGPWDFWMSRVTSQLTDSPPQNREPADPRVLVSLSAPKFREAGHRIETDRHCRELHDPSERELAEVYAGNAVSFCFAFPSAGQEQRRTGWHDGDDDQEFDQGKRVPRGEALVGGRERVAMTNCPRTFHADWPFSDEDGGRGAAWLEKPHDETANAATIARTGRG
jgi:hypothetical protein